MAKLQLPISPLNLGLYLDRPSSLVPPGGLDDCLNVRIRNGQLTNGQIGWSTFPSATGVTLNGPVTLIHNWFDTAGTQYLMLGSDTDLYLFDNNLETVSYITPIYATGTVNVTNGNATVTGDGTTWSTNLKASDEISVGSATQTTPGAVWYVIARVVSDRELTLTTTYAQSTAIIQAYTGRKLFGGTLTTPWDSETFHKDAGTGSDLWYATNGVDAPVEWTPGAAQVTDLGGDSGDTLDFICKTVTRWKNTMVWGNIDVDTGSGRSVRPFTLRMSAPGDPTNATDLGAVELQIHGGPDPILKTLPLGDNLVVYSQHATTAKIVVLQRISSPLLFALRQASVTAGPLSRRGIVNFGSHHEFLSGSGGYSFDGATITPINNHVFREVSRAHSPDRAVFVQAHIDEANGDLVWAVPRNDDPTTINKLLLETGGTDNLLLETGAGNEILLDEISLRGETAFVQHYLENTGRSGLVGNPVAFTLRDAPFTEFGHYERIRTIAAISGFSPSDDRFYREGFVLSLAGDENGKLFIWNGADDQAGTAITSTARMGRLPTVDGRRVGNIRRIYPLAEINSVAGTNLTIRVHTANHPADDLTNAGDFVYDLTVDRPRFVSPRVTARYFQIEFRTTDGDIWIVDGLDFDIPIGGQV